MNRIFTLLLIGILSIQSYSVVSQNGRTLNCPSEFKYASVANININGFSGLTIEAWVKLTQYMPVGSANGNAIFAKESTYTLPHANYGFLLIVLNELQYQGHYRRLAFGLNFGPNGETHIGLHSNNEIALHEWHHIAGTWDGTTMKVYIDGEFDGEYNVSTLGTVYDPVSLLHFGVRLNGVSNLVHYGAIDDARIWNYARSESEIRATMYQNLIGNENGLYAYYKFDELSGQTILDSGPNGLNGYLGEYPSSDYWDATRISSTVPTPYYTVQSGTWDNNSTWATGQLAPANAWTKVKVKHNVVISTDMQVKDLIIDPAAGITINPGIDLTVDGTLINNAGISGLVIQSDITGTGSLIESSGNINGTVKRFLTQNQWHFIGIPIESATAEVFYLPNGSDIYLKTHIESTNSWGQTITDVNTPLIQGRGYECWVDDNVNQDEVIQFTGILNSGDCTTGSGDFYSLQYTPGHGLNFISNPYPSPLQANIHSWTKTNVSNKVYVWSQASGNYLFWNGTDGTNGFGYGTLTGGIIPSMQAFFIEANGTNPTLTIPQSSRIHSSQAYYKDSEIPFNTLRFDVEGNGYKDGIFISFEQSSTEGYDPYFDVEKINGLYEAPQLYTEIPGKKLSINALPAWDESRTISIGFECMVVSNYTIKAYGLEAFEANADFYLQDLKEQVIQNLRELPVYTFTGGGDDDPSRFLLHFGKPNAVEDQLHDLVKVYSEGNSLNIINPMHDPLVVTVYDITGRQVVQQNFNDEGHARINNVGETGYYLVKIQTTNRIITKKVFIR